MNRGSTILLLILSAFLVGSEEQMCRKAHSTGLI